jgi:hypothetical protein
MVGKKVALLVPVSQEVMMSNAAGLYDQLQQDLPTAISRAFDYAAIHGLDLKSGGAGPFGDYLAMTPNSQVIGSTAAASGGVYTDLWKGVQQVVNAPQQGYEFSGFAADPRLRPEAAMSTDANGRSFFNTGVSGKYYRQGDGVQTVTLVGSPTGGTFTVTVGGQTTAGIAYNATGATVTTAVQLLTGTEAANLVVTGSAGGPYTFTFSGPASPVTINQKSLTGFAGHRRTVPEPRLRSAGYRRRLLPVRLRRRNGHHHQGVHGGQLLRRVDVALRVPGELGSSAR